MNESRNMEITIHVCFAVLNVFGNTLVIYLFFVDRALRHKQANRFVISLAFCDLLVAVIYIPYQIFREAIQKVVSVPVDGYVTSISALGSLWNLSALTYDRYVAVFDCLRYEQVMRSKRVTKIMAAIWVSDFFITLLPLTWRFAVPAPTDELLLHGYQCILVTGMIVVHVVLLAVYVRIFITNRHHLSFLHHRSRMFNVQRQKKRQRNRPSLPIRPCPMRLFGRFQREEVISSDPSSISLQNDSMILKNISAIPVRNDVSVSLWEANTSEHMAGLCTNRHLTPTPDLANRRASERASSASSGRTTFRLRAGKALEKVSHSRAVSVELRAARVVLILFIFNTVCWIPTVTLNVVYLISWLRKRPVIPATLFSVSKYCFLSYSSINPWIYGILKGDFKKAMKRHIIQKVFATK